MGGGDGLTGLGDVEREFRFDLKVLLLSDLMVAMTCFEEKVTSSAGKSTYSRPPAYNARFTSA